MKKRVHNLKMPENMLAVNRLVATISIQKYQKFFRLITIIGDYRYLSKRINGAESLKSDYRYIPYRYNLLNNTFHACDQGSTSPQYFSTLTCAYLSI